MKKKGFTLIELLAVIVILAIIALIATPIVLNIIEKSRKEAFQNTAYGIINAAELHYTEGILDNKVEEKVFIFPQEGVDTLKFSGTEPKGGQVEVTKSGEVSIAIHNGEWCAMKEKSQEEVTLKEYEEGNCNLEQFSNIPVITLNGGNEIIIGLGETYEEPGYTVKTASGTEIDSNLVKVEGIVNTSTIGTYTVTYTVTYEGQTTTTTRTVNVVGLEPVITLKPDGTVTKENPTKITVTITPGPKQEVESFTYKINDGEENTVTGTTKEIELSTEGSYTVTVTATDKNGHTATKTSEEIVIDTTAPVISIPEENTKVKITEVTNYDLLTGVTVTDNSGKEIIPTIEGTLDAFLGEYTITYKAEDEAGNITTIDRVIVVTEAEGPILSFTPEASEGYTKALTLTIASTDTSKLSSFSYEIMKDGTSLGVENVDVTNNSGIKEISLGETGNYIVKLTSKDENGNTNELTSGTYKIDADKPVITVNPTTLTVYTDEIGNYNVMDGVTASDNIDGELSNITADKTLTSTVGNQTITYSVTDSVGNTGTASRTYTVKNRLVTSITVSPSSVTTYVGYTANVTATVSPSDALNKTLEWTSSNTSIATVSTSGVVTGVGIGSTTITVKSTDGGNVSKSITVTVKPGIPTGTYTAGQVVNFAGENWFVMSDNGTNTKLVLTRNLTMDEVKANFPAINTHYVQQVDRCIGKSGRYLCIRRASPMS